MYLFRRFVDAYVCLTRTGINQGSWGWWDAAERQRGGGAERRSGGGAMRHQLVSETDREYRHTDGVFAAIIGLRYCGTISFG